MGAVDELARAVKDVTDAAGPSVVGIRGPRGLGSGVVVGDGAVLTNAHNLAAAEVYVTFADGRCVPARARAVDVDGDLALLDVATDGVAAIAWSEEPASLGDVVFALARPGGQGLRTTFGVVSATGSAFRGPRGRRITGSLEHSAPLPRGSSGGPVVDAAGRLLAINTNRLGDGFYQAIPANAGLRERVERLRRGESPSPVRLGVALAPPGAARHLRRAVGLPERDGLLVRGVQEASAAERAGLREGDLLVAADGRALAGLDDLHDALAGAAAAGSMRLAVVRGLDELEVVVSFGADAGGERA